jgi:hypothetical protein
MLSGQSESFSISQECIRLLVQWCSDQLCAVQIVTACLLSTISSQHVYCHAALCMYKQEKAAETRGVQTGDEYFFNLDMWAYDVATRVSPLIIHELLY